MKTNMKINSFTVIGLGKVGKIFTHIFKNNLNFKLDYIVDKKENGSFSGVDILNDIPEKIDSDLIIISTPDDNILSIINLLNSEHIIKKDVIFLHFSGALYIKGNNVVSIHPMMSITNYENDLKRLKEHYFTLQSDSPELIDIFKPVLSVITKNYMIIEGDDKKYFHLSAVMINNFSTALVNSSAEVMKRAGLSEKEALDILLPLFKDVFVNLSNNQDIRASLTGPVVRNDNKTIEKHIKLLESHKMTDEEFIYNSFLSYMKKLLQ